MNKTKYKSKALKNTGKDAGFFRALFFGVAVSLAVWILLCLVFALVMSKQTDSNALGKILSPVSLAISLVVGGSVTAKIDKQNGMLSAFTLGTLVLAIGYIVCTAFNLSNGYGIVMKTVIVATVLLCPVIGAKLVNSKKWVNPRRVRRNM